MAKPKLKPDFDPEEAQYDLIETVCKEYKEDVSIRTLAGRFHISPMKARKILITGGAFRNAASDRIGELYRDGKTVEEIAALLGMTTANVNSYLPYERIIYGMEEKSVEADRQQRYRDRKAGRIPPVREKGELPKMERVRDKTMVIVVGQKLRKMLPPGVLDETSDPLARENSLTWGTNIGGRFILHEPKDPDKSIWCAEVTTNGRGKDKKTGVVLMSANSGFAVISPFPIPPVLMEMGEIADYDQRRAAERENRGRLDAYRRELESVFIDAIRTGLLAFSLPEDRVLDYTDTVYRIELVKGRRSAAGIRLEELIRNDLQWKPGMDPVERFNVRGNWTNRKFGNSCDYRDVDKAVQNMLGMDASEKETWIEAFLEPVREKLATEG